MALKTFVKVGNITNLSDARYCAGMGVDQLGFCIDNNSDSFVDESTRNSIAEWVSGVAIVSETRSGTHSEYPTDIVQLPFRSDPLPKGKKLILEIPIGDLSDSLLKPEDLEYFLVTGPARSISTEEIELLIELSPEFPLVLGFGFGPDNVESILESTGIQGIAMLGSEELRPGYKDYDELADILELLEEKDWD